MTKPTRTEQGYAYWKEELKYVARARTLAEGKIAKKRLAQELGALVKPLLDWLNKALGGRP